MHTLENAHARDSAHTHADPPRVATRRGWATTDVSVVLSVSYARFSSHTPYKCAYTILHIAYAIKSCVSRVCACVYLYSRRVYVSCATCRWVCSQGRFIECTRVGCSNVCVCTPKETRLCELGFICDATHTRVQVA